MLKGLRNCPDCGAAPGEKHDSGCDVEMCSVCGCQRIDCGHKEHDRAFSRWTGLWPGEAESKMLGIDLNDFYAMGYAELFFIKPGKDKKGV